ncbi:hypothetical protein G9P44_000069 [Scheffersomyces stipitis]|nr:hypothetical protein G9P44_000069 [Scheffersomyces stipitis]
MCAGAAMVAQFCTSTAVVMGNRVRSCCWADDLYVVVAIKRDVELAKLATLVCHQREKIRKM